MYDSKSNIVKVKSGITGAPDFIQKLKSKCTRVSQAVDLFVYFYLFIKTIFLLQCLIVVVFKVYF